MKDEKLDDMQVDLNGKKWDLNDLAHYMDDEIREELHQSLATCDPQVFLDEYCKRHMEVFGSEFEVL